MNRQEVLKLASEIYVAGYNRTNPIAPQDAVRAARSLIAVVTLTQANDKMKVRECKQRAAKAKALELIDNS